MATTLNIARFIRSVRQGRTAAPVSCTAMDACTRQAYDALLAASWMQVEELESGLPRHNWAQTGFSNLWDAAKYCGDYADGYQHGYATAVCYTFRMPAAAIDGDKITSIAIPMVGDRWLADGCDLDIYVSASVDPPALGATTGRTDYKAALFSVIPANDGDDSSATITFTWDGLGDNPAAQTCLAYVHIVLRLTNYLTHRGAWIEGGAAIDGANIDFTFDGTVTADSRVEFEDDAYRTASGKFQYAPWDPFTVHSSVMFRPVMSASFGSEDIGFYQEVLANMNVPTFKNWTYTGSVWSNVNGVNFPLCAGFYRSQSTEAGVMTFAVASVFGRSVEVPYGYSVNAISFGTIFPDPPAGITLRLAIYGADAYRGNCWSGTEDDFRKTMVFPSRIAPSSAMNPNFWKGTATEMKGIDYDNSMGAVIDNPPPGAGATGSMVAVSFPIVPLRSLTTTTGYEAGAVDKIFFDAPWKAPNHAMIILAVSVDSIDLVPNPPLTGIGNTYHGVNWFCPYLNFHFVKSVG